MSKTYLLIKKISGMQREFLQIPAQQKLEKQNFKYCKDTA